MQWKERSSHCAQPPAWAFKLWSITTRRKTQFWQRVNVYTRSNLSTTRCLFKPSTHIKTMQIKSRHNSSQHCEERKKTDTSTLKNDLMLPPQWPNGVLSSSHAGTVSHLCFQKKPGRWVTDTDMLQKAECPSYLCHQSQTTQGLCWQSKPENPQCTTIALLQPTSLPCILEHEDVAQPGFKVDWTS